MDNYRTEKTEIPDWMCRQEEYNPSADKEAFLTRSTKSVLSVLARLKFDEGKDGRFSATPSLKLFYTILYIITDPAVPLNICRIADAEKKASLTVTAAHIISTNR